MGLGSFILKSAINSATRGATRGLNRTVNTAVTAAVASGAATAASIAVQNTMAKKGFNVNGNVNAGRPSGYQAGAQTAPRRDAFSDAMLAKLALCYYIAKADGYISPAEQMEIDSVASELLSNPGISPMTKKEMEKFMSMPSISFAHVEKHLNVVDSSTLISFANDVNAIAKASEGVQPAEAKAIEIFEKYVTSKTGYTFEKKAEEQKVTQVNLTCDCCNGTMELDATMLKATCPYCGSAKIIDASQISSVMSEIERTKRANGGY